ncbi:MAG TPA: endo-1,4-beta-xylanase [Vicinamibacteria bacterium]|nr:endo-1,4-beta-xylanase [Vicinamibacteria bacterium]
MAGHRRPRVVAVAVAAPVLLLVAFAAATWLTAPGRRGLAGAEARASAWRSLPPLRALADRAGVRFGSAVMVRDMRSDPRYSPALAREFNSVTPFVEMKWGTIHPERNRFDFGQADELVAFAGAHHMRVRGHALVYGQVVDPPNPAYLAQTADPDALRALMASHIQTVMKRYAGRVDAWDVVNEPLAWKGSAEQAEGLAEHVFSRTLGPGYVAEALRLARAADPAAQLFVNEFGTLEPGSRQERCYRLVRRLRQEGAPLDAVGFQGHVVPLFGGAGPTRGQIEATLRRFAALGVAVEITELNVFTRTPRHLLTLGLAYDEAAELQRQADAYGNAVRACLEVPACQGVTVWTFTDRYPTTIETKTRLKDIPLLFDDEYRPKPAAFAVREALARATPRTLTARQPTEPAVRR